MTKLLEKAVAKANSHPDAEQNAIARIVVDEIESERNWDRQIAKCPKKLRKLVDKAWEKHQAGLSQELYTDKLSRN